MPPGPERAAGPAASTGVRQATLLLGAALLALVAATLGLAVRSTDRPPTTTTMTTSTTSTTSTTGPPPTTTSPVHPLDAPADVIGGTVEEGAHTVCHLLAGC